jgi:hypothetical protein
MTKYFDEPSIKVVKFDTADVITTSNGGYEENKSYYSSPWAGVAVTNDDDIAL